MNRNKSKEGNEKAAFPHTQKNYYISDSVIL